MQRWSGRVALVTGASAGIGAAIAKQLVDNGMIVVGMARRVEKIEEAVGVKKSDPHGKCCITKGCHKNKKGQGKLYVVKGDVRKEDDILAAFKWVTDNLGGVDVLVNNAGVFGDGTLTASDTEEWRWQLDINVLGLSLCTREAIKSMRERGVDDGHIIHISSIAGHIQPTMPNGAMYFATKHAVRALTEGLRKDLVASKSKIRVTSVSPGLVKTDIMNDLKVFTKEMIYGDRPAIEPKDIADVVVFALAAPPTVQIHEVIVKPVGEAE